ncbi:MAG: hypothetical protein MUF03_10710 [Rubrivivax sp.]|nr:hypothetical protein [Rubrivivax sp.]
MGAVAGATCRARRVGIALRGAQHGDLGPHQRAVDREEAQQRQPGVVADPLGPAACESPGQRRQPVAPQVHEGEADVGDQVAVAQRGVELERIEEGRYAVDDDDVAQVQVAVALADEARRAPLGQPGRQSSEGRLGPRAQCGETPRPVRRQRGSAVQRV